MSQGKLAVVAVDGPAGSGKSTISKRVADQLGFRYVDTGAMYRAMAWLVLDAGLDPEDHSEVARLIREATLEVFPDGEGMGVRVNGRVVTTQIRSERISTVTSQIARIPEVRETMVRHYRALGKEGRVVLEGRDIGTVAFPEAPLKIFLTASVEARARRRFEQEGRKEESGEEIRKVESAIRSRDRRDSERVQSPLVQAADAVEIDTTSMSIEQVCAKVLDLARERLNLAKRREG